MPSLSVIPAKLSFRSARRSKESLQPESRFLVSKTNWIPDSIFFRHSAFVL